MNAPIEPQPYGPPYVPIIAYTADIIWDGKTALRGQIRARWSNETATVLWQGDLSRIAVQLPKETDSCVLRAWMEDQAEKTGGVFSERQDGLWPAMDYVKS
jgi:hypothetical protein